MNVLLGVMHILVAVACANLAYWSIRLSPGYSDPEERRSLRRVFVALCLTVIGGLLGGLTFSVLLGLAIGVGLGVLVLGLMWLLF